MTTMWRIENGQKSQHRQDTAQLTEEEIQNIFCYLPNFRVLICREHRTAVQNIKSHIRDHHTVSREDARRIYSTWTGYCVKKPEEIELPTTIGQPIDVLGEPLGAYQCVADNCDYISVNLDVFRVHCKKQHGMIWKNHGLDLFIAVKVQTFFRAPGLQRYFIVQSESVPLRNSRAVQESINSGDEAGQVKIILDEWSGTQREHEEKQQIMEVQTAKTDKTGWYNRTGWLQHLAGRNKKHLAHAIRLPGRNEQQLKRAARLTEQLVEQSVAGLSTLARETRRWLKSAQREEIDQRPLARLQNPESQARYASYIVMFVCYSLRVVESSEKHAEDSEDETDSSSSGEESSLDDASSYADSTASSAEDSEQRRRRQEVDIFKDAREMFPWQGQQYELTKNFLLSLSEDNNDDGKQILILLEMLASFIFVSTADDPFTNGLIHFLAILGIDSEMDRLRTAKDYSYRLAGVVYCMRVVGVEILLPSAYRRQQGDADREVFLRQRKEFLADGSFSPMSEMLSLLAYGKFIGMTAGNSGNAFWSRDKKIFYLNGRPIEISRFQQMARDVVMEAEELLWHDLLWTFDRDERFVVSLDRIVDNVTFTKRGISFVSNFQNQLQGGLKWMLQRVVSSETGKKLRAVDGKWRIKQVRQYIRRVNRFLEFLLLAVHITSGQPGRGTEITTMRRVNGVLQDRNIFVMDGQVMTVVRYHKTQSQWDKPKIVPRFLPWRLGQVMVVYLAYLQPFQEYLEVQVLGGGFHDYVWANEQGPWSTQRLTNVLQRETAKRLGTSLHTLDYRHTAVGIGRVVVGEAFGRGYQDEVGEVEEAEIEDDEESALELQSARTTAIGVNNYSVPVDIIKHLSVRSIDAFRPLSELWHRFLGLSSREDEEVAGLGLGLGLGLGPGQQQQLQQHQRLLASRVKTAKRNRASDEKIENNIELIARAQKRPRFYFQDDRSDTRILQAMQQALGCRDVGFRSVEQEQAMQAVIAGQTPLVVILPTGGGKSLLFMAPACMENAGVTIVVVPYRALIEDLLSRLESRGIDCLEWVYGEMNPAAVVVVSADVAGDAGFIGYAAMLSSKKLLQRIVVDECHLTFTSSDWRPKLSKLKNLRVLACPIVLLTATLPPVREQELGESMLVRNATYIRARTARVNTRYTVSVCKDGEQQESALGICHRQQQRLERDKVKGVVYCSSKAQCEQIAEALKCEYYHAGVVDRAERLAEWMQSGGFIVATSALGTGVDIPGIVVVIHVGMPWGMIDFAQESGRGGRQGEMVDSIVVIGEKEVETRLQQNGSSSSSSVETHAMALFLQTEDCRRGAMSEYLDGVRVECGEIEEAASCDRCGEGVAEWQERNKQYAKEWEQVQNIMTELQNGCVVCWVIGDALGFKDGWLSHSGKDCMKYEGMINRDLDNFRRYIRHEESTHSCMKCGVSQKFCATGEREDMACQWPNVMVAMSRSSVSIKVGVAIIRNMGYRGEFKDEFQEFGVWLGKRYRERIWGVLMSNMMALCIKLMLELDDGEVGWEL